MKNNLEKVKIGDLFNIEKGPLQSSKNVEGEYTFITASSEWKTHNQYTHDVEAIIIAVAASGSLGRAHYVNGKFISSDLCFILTPKSKKYPLDLSFYYFIFNAIRDDLVKSTARGTSKLAINKSNFSDYKLPYLDVSKQREFKNKLVNITGRKEQLVSINGKQTEFIQSLRQQILQDAITGKLSKKWRNARSQDLRSQESAEVLLEKIKMEKEKLVKEGASTGSARAKKQKPLPPILENEIPFELPEGWVWCNGNLASDYIDPQPSHRTPVESTDGIPYVAMSNINEDGTINFSSCRKVSKGILDEHQRRYQIKNGDFVIGKIGTIGNPTILPLPQNYTLSANIVLIQPRTDVAMPLFLYYLLKSPFYISKMIESKSEMSYPVFGIKKMRLIIIPLPPLAEQQYIVERIESLFAKLDRIKELNIENQKNIDLLNQVVLKEMFEVQ